MSELKNKDNFTDMANKPSTKVEINEKDYHFLNDKTDSEIEDKINEIKDFMKNNDGKLLKTEEKDELYGEAQKKWSELSLLLNDAEFGLILNREEYNYMTSLLLDKMEYDVNLLFFAIELTTMLGNMKLKKDSEKYTNDIDPITYKLTATDITYLYHVLQNHKVKGLKKSSYTFADIIRRIGSISKVFSHYDNLSKELSTEIQDWTVGFEEESNAKTMEIT